MWWGRGNPRRIFWITEKRGLEKPSFLAILVSDEPRRPDSSASWAMVFMQSIVVISAGCVKIDLPDCSRFRLTEAASVAYDVHRQIGNVHFPHAVSQVDALDCLSDNYSRREGF